MSRAPRRRKCLCCSKFFFPDPRTAGRQRYCSKPDCRQSSKAASQRRWLSKDGNGDVFRGPVDERQKEIRPLWTGQRQFRHRLIRPVRSAKCPISVPFRRTDQGQPSGSRCGHMSHKWLISSRSKRSGCHAFDRHGGRRLWPRGHPGRGSKSCGSSSPAVDNPRW